MGRVSIGRTLSRSWEALIGNIGILLLGGLVFVLIAGVLVPVVFPVSLLVAPPLVVGLCIMCLKCLRGEQAHIHNLFSGFSHMLPACIVGIALVALGVLVCLALVPLIEAQVAHDFGGAPPEAGPLAFSTGIMMLLLAALPVCALVFIPLLGMAFPAVADGMGAIEAIVLSLRRGLSNWPALAVLGIVVVAGTIVSQIIPYIGLAAALPWACVVMTAAYLQVVDETPEAEAQARPSVWMAIVGIVVGALIVLWLLVLMAMRV